METIESPTYCSRLSSRQKAWAAAALLGAVLIVATGMLGDSDRQRLPDRAFTPESSIKQIAPQLGVTGRALARELELPLNVLKQKPLTDLGVSSEQLAHATAHLLAHRPTRIKYHVFVALVLLGLVFLVRLGRPDGADVFQRRIWYPRVPYLLALVVAVAVCGFAYGKSPNPMEAGVKLFKALVGLYPSVLEKAIALLFFIALAVVGNKLVCGWACPFGAIQELTYSIPILRSSKRRKLPFWVSNSIRGTLFVVMLGLLFGIIGGMKGFVVYHAINPFNLFNFDFDEWLVPVVVIASVALSLFIYRPFCYWICPFGFLSWFAERLSLFRVRIDRAKCTRCGACTRACPSGAAKGMVEGRLFTADCMSCARCLSVCPHDAIRYRLAFTSTQSEDEHYRVAREPRSRDGIRESAPGHSSAARDDSDTAGIPVEDPRLLFTTNLVTSDRPTDTR